MDEKHENAFFAALPTPVLAKDLETVLSRAVGNPAKNRAFGFMSFMMATSFKSL